MAGGYLGVDLFFVLSGFPHHLPPARGVGVDGADQARGVLGTASPAAAARPLPPPRVLALFVALDGRFGPAAQSGSVDLPGLRGDGLATVFYVANWHSILAHQSYFAQFSAPSPLQHTWSLAIEEQFYFLWPLILLALLHVAGRYWRRAGIVLTAAGALGSAALMALLFHPGGDPTRVYFGTDTRAFDMLAGATVAMLAAARPSPRRRRGPRSTSARRRRPWRSACSGSEPAPPPASRLAGCSVAASCCARRSAPSWSPTSARSTAGRWRSSCRSRRCAGSG